MRLAIDAITQAEGSPAATVSTAPNRSQKPATTSAAPVAVTVLPTAHQTPPQEQTVNAPTPENARRGPDTRRTERTGRKYFRRARRDKSQYRQCRSETPKGAGGIPCHPSKPDKWVVTASILASLTGCYRPAINTSSRLVNKRSTSLTPLTASDPDTTAPRPELNPMPFRNWSKGSKRKS